MSVSPLASAALFGFSTGVRSTWPTFRLALERDGFTLSTMALGFATVGEIVADKVAPLPGRTRPGPLLGRMVMAARGGASLSPRERLRGGMIAAGSAMVGAFCAVNARRRLTRRFDAPDWFVAVGEDVAVVVLTELAVRRHNDTEG